MKKITFAILFVLAVLPVSAQFNLSKAIGGAAKAAKALTLTDADMAAYVKESVDWMDTHNPVLPEDNPYTVRLRKLTEGVTEADGIPLNFKVYDVIDVNAFACPDGSVRVFSSARLKVPLPRPAVSLPSSPSRSWVISAKACSMQNTRRNRKRKLITAATIS